MGSKGHKTSYILSITRVLKSKSETIERETCMHLRPLFFISLFASYRTSKNKNMTLAKRNRTLAGWTKQSRHRTLFIPKKESENINKIKERTTMILVVVAKSELRSRLRNGKVLALLTSVVLNRNH